MKLTQKAPRPLASSADVGGWIRSEGMTEDLSDYIAALDLERRYMFVPRRYFIRTFLLYALTVVLMTFFCHGIFIIPMIPAHLFMAFKLRIFFMQCAAFNLSGKKLLLLLAAWYVVSFILTRFLWRWLSDVLLTVFG